MLQGNLEPPKSMNIWRYWGRRGSHSNYPVLKGHPRAERPSKLLVTLKTYICNWSSNPTSGSMPKGPESKDSNRYLCTNCHSSMTHNSQKVETILMFIDRWMNKQNVVFTHNGTHTMVYTHKGRKFWRLLPQGWTLRPLRYVKLASHKRTNIWFHLDEGSRAVRFLQTG